MPESTPPSQPAPFSKVVAIWVPGRFVGANGIDVDGLLADINSKISRQGFVLRDRQVLTTPINPHGYLDVIFEPNSSAVPFPKPPRASWLVAQRDFFGLANPYQMADETDAFTWSHVVASVVEPYLKPGEMIAGVIHGKQDNHYFYCPCHNPTVVYTNGRRVVCMSCGATHLVLREALPISTGTLLSADEWSQRFDQDGPLRDVEVDLPLVDFRDIENADTIWMTDQWEDAAHEFIFFARSSPEAIEEAIRGTESDPSVLLEAGWTRVDLPPPPAFQLVEDSLDVDLAENAGHAYRDGIAAFTASFTDATRLTAAIPQLFRAAELLLKARLESLDRRALHDRPSNPVVLERLRALGVDIPADEIDTIGRLRRLRNNLQHSNAKFNYRTGLALSRRAIMFLDRFALYEIGLWTGDVADVSDWWKLLSIPEVATRAEMVADGRLRDYRRDPLASISLCPRCARSTLLRRRPNTGASCVVCGYVPHDQTADLDVIPGVRNRD